VEYRFQLVFAADRHRLTSAQRVLLTGGEMIALVFVFCLIIYAICFWLTFGELERSQGAIRRQSSSSGVAVDKTVMHRDGGAS
jgi:hypothetical protein